jgi:hypothetical protein
MLKLGSLILIILPLLLALPVKAYGYVDPGSGAFVYQAVYAAFIGGAFYLRKFIRRLFVKRDR